MAITGNDILEKMQKAKEAREAAVEDTAETESVPTPIAATAPNTSLVPAASNAGSAVKSVVDLLPEEVRPYAGAAAGYAGGKMLRSVLPQESVAGTPEFKQAQAGMANAADIVQQHKATAQALQTTLAEKQVQHEATKAALERAAQEHAFAQTVKPEEHYAKYIPEAARTLPGAAQPTLTPQGGQGTANYAAKFGATPEEAMRVASMSQMQQQNIPAQQKAFGMQPGYNVYAESPLMLGPEGKQALTEQLAKQQTAQSSQQTQAAAIEQQNARAKAEIDRQIALGKAQAKMAHDQAVQEHAASRKDLAAAQQASLAHGARSPVASEESLRNQRLANTGGQLLKRLGMVGSRFVPGVGSAMAEPEAELAYKDWQAKNYGRAAVHGLGSLGAAAQATGIPMAMGAGDIAQIPAAGLALYDTYKDLTK